MIIVDVIPLGPLETNCYILSSTGYREAVVIDPGYESGPLFEKLKHVSLKYIVNTHCHLDHTLADQKIKSLTGASLCIHHMDCEGLSDPVKNLSASFGITNASFPEPDILLEEGSNIDFADTTLKVVHTPGHTPGSICLYAEDIMFTGDTLFRSSVGRTDLPGGDQEELLRSLVSISRLKKTMKIYPGHGPGTELSREIRYNPFYSHCR